MKGPLDKVYFAASFRQFIGTDMLLALHENRPKVHTQTNSITTNTTSFWVVVFSFLPVLWLV